MTELNTKQEKMQMLEKWIQDLGEGRRVIGIKNQNLIIQIQTKNFGVAFSIIISSGIALFILGMIQVLAGELLPIIICAFLEIPFALIGYFIQKRSIKTFETVQDGTFKIDGETYFDKQDLLEFATQNYLKIYIKKMKEDNFDSHLRAIAGSSRINLQPLEELIYYHIVLETNTKRTQIGFAENNANKIFELLSNFNYE